MKIERKLMIVGLAFILIGAVVLPSLFASRTITTDSDDVYTKICNSNGDIYEVSWVNFCTSVNETDSGGWVNMAPGTYTITSECQVSDKSISIYGNGALLDFSGWNGNVFHFECTQTADRGYNRVKVCDMFLKGDETKDSQWFINCTDTQLDVYGINNSGIGFDDSFDVNGFVVLFGHCGGSLIHDNSLRTEMGVFVNGVSDSRCANNTKISDNVFVGSYLSGTDDINYGIYFVKYGRDSGVTGNILDGYCYGVYTNGHDYLIVDGNIIRNVLVGVTITSAIMCVVTDNFLDPTYASSHGIEWNSITYGGTCSGNTIYTSVNNDFRGISFDTVKRVIADGNLILQDTESSGTTTGIYGTNACSELMISNNVITCLTPSAGIFTAIRFSSLTDSIVMGNAMRLVNWYINITTNITNLVTNNLAST